MIFLFSVFAQKSCCDANIEVHTFLIWLKGTLRAKMKKSKNINRVKRLISTCTWTFNLWIMSLTLYHWATNQCWNLRLCLLELNHFYQNELMHFLWKFNKVRTKGYRFWADPLCKDPDHDIFKIHDYKYGSNFCVVYFNY